MYVFMYVIYIFFKGEFGQAEVCDQLWSNGNDEGFFF